MLRDHLLTVFAGSTVDRPWCPHRRVDSPPGSPPEPGRDSEDPKTLAAIAQELEARGVRTPVGRDRWALAQVSRPLTLARRFFSRVGPAVAKAYKVIEFSESFIASQELPADVPDHSSNVHPIAVSAVPCDETFVV